MNPSIPRRVPPPPPKISAGPSYPASGNAYRPAAQQRPLFPSAASVRVSSSAGYQEWEEDRTSNRKPPAYYTGGDEGVVKTQSRVSFNLAEDLSEDRSRAGRDEVEDFRKIWQDEFKETIRESLDRHDSDRGESRAPKSDAMSSRDAGYEFARRYDMYDSPEAIRPGRHPPSSPPLERPERTSSHRKQVYDDDREGLYAPSMKTFSGGDREERYGSGQDRYFDEPTRKHVSSADSFDERFFVGSPEVRSLKGRDITEDRYPSRGGHEQETDRYAAPSFSESDFSDERFLKRRRLPEEDKISVRRSAPVPIGVEPALRVFKLMTDLQPSSSDHRSSWVPSRFEAGTEPKNVVDELRFYPVDREEVLADRSALQGVVPRQLQRALSPSPPLLNSNRQVTRPVIDQYNRRPLCEVEKPMDEIPVGPKRANPQPNRSIPLEDGMVQVLKETNGKVTQGVFQRKVTHIEAEKAMGFAGRDIFFHMKRVKGPLAPVVGDTVSVIAERVEMLPFDWNALSIEVISPNAKLPDPELTIPLKIPVNPSPPLGQRKPPPPPILSKTKSAKRAKSPDSPLVVFDGLNIRPLPQVKAKEIAGSKSKKARSSPDRKKQKSARVSPPLANRRSLSPPKAFRRGSSRSISPAIRRRIPRSRSITPPSRRSRSNTPQFQRRHPRSRSITPPQQRRRSRSRSFTPPMRSRLRRSVTPPLRRRSRSISPPSRSRQPRSRSITPPPRSRLPRSRSITPPARGGIPRSRWLSRSRSRSFSPPRRVLRSKSRSSSPILRRRRSPSPLRIIRDRLRSRSRSPQRIIRRSRSPSPNHSSRRRHSRSPIPVSVRHRSKSFSPLRIKDPSPPLKKSSETRKSAVQPKKKLQAKVAPVVKKDPPRIIVGKRIRPKPKVQEPAYKLKPPEDPKSKVPLGLAPEVMKEAQERATRAKKELAVAALLQKANPAQNNAYANTPYPQGPNQPAGPAYYNTGFYGPVPPTYGPAMSLYGPPQPNPGFFGGGPMYRHPGMPMNNQPTQIMRTTIGPAKTSAPGMVANPLHKPSPNNTTVNTETPSTNKEKKETAKGSSIVATKTQEKIVEQPKETSITSDKDKKKPVEESKKAEPSHEKKDSGKAAVLKESPKPEAAKKSASENQNAKKSILKEPKLALSEPKPEKQKSTEILADDNFMSENDFMDPQEAEKFGCDPMYVSQAQKWMACLRCAQDGHLISMCNKDKTKRALPFDIAKAKNRMMTRKKEILSKQNIQLPTNSTKAQTQSAAVEPKRSVSFQPCPTKPSEVKSKLTKNSKSRETSVKKPKAKLSKNASSLASTKRRLSSPKRNRVAVVKPKRQPSRPEAQEVDKGRRQSASPEPLPLDMRRRSISPAFVTERLQSPPPLRFTMATNDPLAEVAVKKLEIQSLELREMEIEQEMRLLQAMSMSAQNRLL